MANIAEMVKNLRWEQMRAKREVERLGDAIAALGKLARNTLGAYAKRFGRKKRTMSAAARRRISLAQKARWAKARRVEALAPVRRMSQAARKKIAAAQRARWAKARAEQKKAA